MLLHFRRFEKYKADILTQAITLTNPNISQETLNIRPIIIGLCGLPNSN